MSSGVGAVDRRIPTIAIYIYKNNKKCKSKEQKQKKKAKNKKNSKWLCRKTIPCVTITSCCSEVV